jgi:predicted ATPase
MMDVNDIAGFTLKGLAKVNVILGKNGCGKSYLLKALEQGLKANAFENVRYISLERGGVLEYMPQIAHTMANNPGYLSNDRRKNQSENFRQQSAALFQRLELRVLRKIEREHIKEGYVPSTFDDTLDELQSLLDRVRLERGDQDKAFTIVEREAGIESQPELSAVVSLS